MAKNTKVFTYEVFGEAYLNEWSSGYARHICRKGLPKRFITAINEQYRYV